jgi:hypothetical protein
LTQFAPLQSHERPGFWPAPSDGVGASLEGVLLGETALKEGRTAIGLQVTPDGEPVLIGVNPSLGDALDALAPPVGATIRVTFAGLKDVGKPQKMREYRVEITKAPVGVSDDLPF